ncbi:hypothetical protein DIPPA_00421 [Diplonema papillatum]|nr:hypothetical protein DIPPA_13338 [Diplonema papillatum]KAJ9451151.1 hypothetical protein DIPPA_00421 [Diplonema papillatum]|eukprot:gene9671-15018_t
MSKASAVKLDDRDKLISEIMDNVAASNELWASLDQKRKERPELEGVEREVIRWMAIGQAAATMLLDTLKEKGLADGIPNEGVLLAKMHVEPDRLQWSEEEQQFY